MSFSIVVVTDVSCCCSHQYQWVLWHLPYTPFWISISVSKAASSVLHSSCLLLASASWSNCPLCTCKISAYDLEEYLTKCSLHKKKIHQFLDVNFEVSLAARKVVFTRLTSLWSAPDTNCCFELSWGPIVEGKRENRNLFVNEFA